MTPQSQSALLPFLRAACSCLLRADFFLLRNQGPCVSRLSDYHLLQLPGRLYPTLPGCWNGAWANTVPSAHFNSVSTYNIPNWIHQKKRTVYFGCVSSFLGGSFFCYSSWLVSGVEWSGWEGRGGEGRG